MLRISYFRLKSRSNELSHTSLIKLGLPVVHSIDGLQSIPRESNDKDAAAMLGELTMEANEESFVIVLQHGGNGVT